MQIHDTLQGERVALAPGADGTLGVYRFRGPLQARVHLGDAFSAVVFDVVVRHLRDQYGETAVRYLVGIPDLDDAMLAAAEAEGQGWRELAEGRLQRDQEDLLALNVAPPDGRPRLSQQAKAALAWLERLEQEDLAYVLEGEGVYFHAGASEDAPGERPEDGRRHPADFCLWSFWDSPDAWLSPWGRGRPGVALASAVMGASLGLPLDLHGGSQELASPLHERERALSEAAQEGPFARVWLHHGPLPGDLPELRGALARHGAGGLRHAFLGTHYRQPQPLDEAHLAEGAQGYARLVQARLAAREIGLRSPQPVDMNAQVAVVEEALHQARSDFLEALDDDLDTPRALGALEGIGKALERAAEWVGEQSPGIRLQTVLQAAVHVMDGCGRVLGFVQPDGEWLPLPGGAAGAEAGLLELLVELRQEAAAREDHATATKIRDRLGELGYELRDEGETTSWRRQ